MAYSLMYQLHEAEWVCAHACLHVCLMPTSNCMLQQLCVTALCMQRCVFCGTMVSNSKG